MPVYARKGSRYWYIRIGRDIDRSSRTTSRAQALALEAKWRQEIWRVDSMGEQPRRTFAEAAADWAEQVGKNRKGWDRDWYRLKALVEAIGDDWTEDLAGMKIESAIPASAVAPASRNHYRSLIRSVLRHEVRSGLLSAAPSIRMQPVNNARIRYLADWSEAERLIQALPPYWRDPARFTLHTGVRLGTLRAIRPEWIHGDLLVVPGDSTKSGRLLALPLSDGAMEIVRRQPPGQRLFQRTAENLLPGMDYDLWRRALKRAKLTDFRWHDLRHTWASWMIMSGQVSLYDLQQLGDWSTPAMVQRYAHLAPGYLRDVVRNASAQIHGTALNRGANGLAQDGSPYSTRRAKH